jgi:hypothetical protein
MKTLGATVYEFGLVNSTPVIRELIVVSVDMNGGYRTTPDTTKGFTITDTRDNAEAGLRDVIAVRLAALRSEIEALEAVEVPQVDTARDKITDMDFKGVRNFYKAAPKVVSPFAVGTEVYRVCMGMMGGTVVEKTVVSRLFLSSNQGKLTVLVGTGTDTSNYSLARYDGEGKMANNATVYHLTKDVAEANLLKVMLDKAAEEVFTR